MIRIYSTNDKLVLEYEQEFSSDDWVSERLNKSESVTFRNTFHFDPIDLMLDTEIQENFEDEEADGNVSRFTLAVKNGDYYVVKARVLNIKSDLYLAEKGLRVTVDTFIAIRNISIFRRIDRLINEPIVIGGNKGGAIPISEFNILLKNFPTTTEITHYANSRVSLILEEYLGSMTDAQKQLSDYLNRKRKSKNSIHEVPELYEFEVEKYEYIRDRIHEMLSDEKRYSENEWQQLMLKFILLIFPKYVVVLQNINIRDYYSKPSKVTNRYIDVGLVDSNGNLDIIEIKKPFTDHILTKRKYRGNYTPERRFSGSIMQAEKYLFHLSKWGVKGEKILSEKHGNELPQGVEIKITNPKAIIIVGRSNDFNAEQKFDFELIKRKYANILDVITYDDLLFRLNNIIEKFRKLADEYKG